MKQTVTKVLLSIKPQFANKIFDGSKLYEFRKTIFKNTEIKTVIVYASSPVKKIIGEFEIDVIINEDVDILWERTKKKAGISEEFFYKYFECRDKGYAIKIKKAVLYDNPLNLTKMPAPQSFAYVK